MGEPGTVLPVCEQLLHMVNTHRAIKDCAAMSEAANTIAALYEALDALIRHIEPNLTRAIEAGYPNEEMAALRDRARAALSLALGEKQS